MDATLQILLGPSPINVHDLKPGSITGILVVKYKHSFFSQLAQTKNLEIPWPNTKSRTTKITCIAFQGENLQLIELHTIEDIQKVNFSIEEQIGQEITADLDARAFARLTSPIKQKFRGFDPETFEPVDWVTPDKIDYSLYPELNPKSLKGKFRGFDPETFEPAEDSSDEIDYALN